MLHNNNRIVIYRIGYKHRKRRLIKHPLLLHYCLLLLGLSLSFTKNTLFSLGFPPLNSRVDFWVAEKTGNTAT